MERYISDQEYPTHFEKLGDLRSRIAKDLPIKTGMRILDVATGDGFFAIEIAKLYGDVKVIGIDISPSIAKRARRNIIRQNLQDIIEIFVMDAANMHFSREEFDMAVDFTGLEDIQMTRGRKGVQLALFEVNRVLKLGGCFCFAEMLPEKMETKAQEIETALFSYICGRNKGLSGEEYKAMLKEAKFNFIAERDYYSGLKFTPQQAKREIKYVIRNVRKIYGIPTPSFNDVWAKFGEDIEKNGMGCYSKVTLFITQKVQDLS